jgi:uncharacterized protein with FMN-binding domain
MGNNVHYPGLMDGVYEGYYKSFPNSALVEVTIEKGKIVQIVITRHNASWIGNQAKGIIVERIIEQQSTSVDVVTGATNTSHVIMNAVHAAVEKAHPSLQVSSTSR